MIQGLKNKIVLLLVVSFVCESAFITITLPGKQCFVISTLPNENILVHVKVPQIEGAIFRLQSEVKGKVVFNKQITKI